MMFRNDRLKTRRKALRLTQQALADLVGVTQKAIAKWEKGGTDRPQKLKELSEALECSEDWLLGSDGKPERPSGVGVISWVKAGDVAEIIDNYEPGDAESWIDYPSKHSKMIGLRVDGSSMNRISPDGSIIVVDLMDREMTPNRLYVVKVGDGATYKRYRDNPPRLEPDSTEPHDIIFLNGQGYLTIGRVKRTLIDFD